MPFYASVGPEQADPKRSFRFLFYLPSNTTQGGLQSYTVKDVKKPTFQMEGGPQIRYIQHTFKYPGRVMWNDVTVTVVDPGGSEDAGATLFNMLARSGYSRPSTDELSRTSISKGKALAALGQPKIVQIDSEAREIEQWTLHNAYLSQVDFGQVSYDNDEIVNISLTMVYDYATLFKTGKPVDAAVRSKA